MIGALPASPVCGVGRAPVEAAFGTGDGAGPVGPPALLRRHGGAHVAQNGRRAAHGGWRWPSPYASPTTTAPSPLLGCAEFCALDSVG